MSLTFALITIIKEIKAQKIAFNFFLHLLIEIWIDATYQWACSERHSEIPRLYERSLQESSILLSIEGCALKDK